MILLTSFHEKISKVRLNDMIECLKINIRNESIDKIIVFYQSCYEHTENLPNEIKIFLENSKFNLNIITRHPDLSYMFSFANTYFKNKICIYSNSDIYFPKWSNIEKINDIDMDDKFLVLTRWNKIDELSKKTRIQTMGEIIEIKGDRYMTQWKNGCSIDTWIFKSPLNIPIDKFNFKIGLYGIDGVTNYLLKKYTKVFNPCLEIFSIHKHTDYILNKYHKITYNGKEFPKHIWVKKMILDKDTNLSNIPFCRLTDINNS